MPGILINRRVFIAPSGFVYVADGYGNSRIVEFSPQGKYVFCWGKRGSGRGESHTPHALAMDTRGNLHVADRENFRIQVFDPDGQSLAVWPCRAEFSAIVIRGQFLTPGPDRKT
jgi:peptidylamidoglycolate lyase